MGLLWFLLGLVIGAGATWFWAQRRCDERIEDLQQSWDRRLQHAQQEVGGADAAHEETKERLRETQARVQALEAENRRLQQEAEAARRAAGEAREQERQMRAERGAGRGSGAEAGAVAGAPAPATTSAARDPVARRLKEIDAKLAQLPAGSTARRRLQEEKQRLLAGEEGPARSTPASDATDDLRRIKGIGPAIAEKLSGLGITTFRQLAALTPEEVERLDRELGLRGRIVRERWVEQARELVAAGQG